MHQVSGSLVQALVHSDIWHNAIHDDSRANTERGNTETVSLAAVDQDTRRQRQSGIYEERQRTLE